MREERRKEERRGEGRDENGDEERVSYLIYNPATTYAFDITVYPYRSL